MSADHFSFGFVGLVDDEPTRLLLELLRELPAGFLGLFDFLGHLLLLRPDRRSYQIQTILRVRFAKEDQKPISSVRCIQVVEMSGPDILPDSPSISRARFQLRSSELKWIRENVRPPGHSCAGY
jgi:hypothetical protein